MATTMTATTTMARWPRPLALSTSAPVDADALLAAKPTETPRKLKPQPVAAENNAALDDSYGDGGDDGDNNQTTDDAPRARCRRPMSCHSPRPKRRELKPSESFRRSNQHALERIQEVDAADEDDDEDESGEDAGDVQYDGDSESDEELGGVGAGDRPLDRSASGGELLVQYVDDAETVLCAHRRRRRRQLLLRLGRSRAGNEDQVDEEDEDEDVDEEDDDVVRI
ncbi:hypothetical protein P43SY_007709 [Pythium insidiosum]|uniref:Uncharacterized protein n=1 Tax=Pythium insidiosum TaxID=114742 RepID=A0AAD5Q938_PYTIN|nr:hypothetical protein P43SY_007709 [Pythium insidiosum]